MADEDGLLTLDSALRHPHTTTKDSNEGSLNRDIEVGHMSSEMAHPPPDHDLTYDYIRVLARHRVDRSQVYHSPLYTANPDSPTHRCPITTITTTITISPLSPPAYAELYLQHPSPTQQSQLRALVRQMERADDDLVEVASRLVLGLEFVTLTIFAVGLAFNWARPIAVRAGGPSAYGVWGMGAGAV